ncbi:hypothetical protein M434DRAFT_31850 [Hypoxylon sp. CO27-5]|nr:hypothetical protein M434DRAFT_31850 [Hypoxylon sp. CO27-5]
MDNFSLFDNDDDYSYLLDELNEELNSPIPKPPKELSDESSNEPFTALGNKLTLSETVAAAGCVFFLGHALAREYILGAIISAAEWCATMLLASGRSRFERGAPLRDDCVV